MIDINALAGQYTGRLISVAGVFKAVLPVRSTFHPYTEARPTPSPGFLFVIKGHGSFTFNGTAYQLHPGIVVHGGKGMSLTMTTSEAELEYILVRYHLQDMEHTELFTTWVTNHHFELAPGPAPQLTEMLHQLYDSNYTPGHMAMIRTTSLFQMVLYELLSSCLNRQNGTSRDMMEQARAYIHNHYMETLNLQKLAERHGISVKSFSYFFKKYIGVFPIDYLIQHRMKRAQELLTMGNFSIKQVAASVGYEDSLYFSRLYKKHYGYAPSESRRI